MNELTFERHQSNGESSNWKKSLFLFLISSHFTMIGSDVLLTPERPPEIIREINARHIQ